MQTIGIVSVLASAIVALVATLVAARTQVRLHHLERTNARLAELRDVVDSAAQMLVRAKYVLADAEDLREHVDWDRGLVAVEARLQVRLGSNLQLYDDFLLAWRELHELKQAFPRSLVFQMTERSNCGKTSTAQWIVFSRMLQRLSGLIQAH